MKKILTLAVVAIAAVCGSAKADGLYLGGNVAFMHEHNDEFSYNQLTVLPEVGYNFNDKWAVGGTVGYDYLHICNAKVDYNMFEFNPYARFTYFRTDNNLLQLFIDGGAGFGTGRASYHNDYIDDSDTAVIWNVGFRPGIAINVTDKISIVSHIGFLGYQGANNTALESGLFVRKGGFSLDSKDVTFGFYYNF